MKLLYIADRRSAPLQYCISIGTDWADTHVNRYKVNSVEVVGTVCSMGPSL